MHILRMLRNRTDYKMDVPEQQRVFMHTKSVFVADLALCVQRYFAGSEMTNLRTRRKGRAEILACAAVRILSRHAPVFCKSLELYDDGSRINAVCALHSVDSHGNVVRYDTGSPDNDAQWITCGTDTHLFSVGILNFHTPPSVCELFAGNGESTADGCRCPLSVAELCGTLNAFRAECLDRGIPWQELTPPITLEDTSNFLRLAQHDRRFRHWPRITALTIPPAHAHAETPFPPHRAAQSAASSPILLAPNA